MANSAQAILNHYTSLSPPAAPIPEHRAPALLQSAVEARSMVDFSPPEIISCHSAALPGVHVETVQAVRHRPFEYGFRAPCHLLIAAELAERYDGETFVEGLPRSTLRDFTRKLTFVPAGHDFRGSQKPRALMRTTYIYIDQRGPLADPALRFGEIEFRPRLFFYDRDLWEIAFKLKSLVENPGWMHRRYAEALGILLTHELVRINGDAVRLRAGQPWRSGVLAAKAGRCLYRGACRRRHPARDPRRAGTAKPVPFLPVVQTFLRRAAAQISRQSSDRACQAATGES
jgi:AraC family transcriptional regulator